MELAPPDAESDLELLRFEVKDRVSELEQQFMALEQAHSEGKATIEALHLILRQAHSLKGCLAMAAQPVTSHSVHAMEAAFVALREGRLAPSRDFFDLAFASLDQFSHAGEKQTEDEVALNALAARWDAIKDGADGETVRGHAGLPFSLTPSEVTTLQRAVFLGHRLYLVEKSILSATTKESYETLPIYEDIAGIGFLVARRPAFTDLDPKQRETVLLLLVASALDPQAVGEQIFDPTLPVNLSPKDRDTYLAKTPTSPSPEPAPEPAPEGIRVLVVEDDFTCRLVLQKFLAPFGESHVAVDGEEALAAVRLALEAQEPYQLICLDIMMPKLDGQATLHALRQIEETHGVPLGKGAKVVMTTCLKDNRNIMEAFRGQCDGYVIKPIARAKLLEQLVRLGLLPGAP
jgi:two-component system chemotaxis response regulator CheY